VVLFLEIPTEAVDVNVHPTKSEVRFREPQRVFPWISRAAREAWGAAKGELPSFYAAPSRTFYGDRDGSSANRSGAPDDTGALLERPYAQQGFSQGLRTGEAMKSLWGAFLPNVPPLDRPYDVPSDRMGVAEAQVLETTAQGYGYGHPSALGAAGSVRYLGAFMDTYILAEYRAGSASELWIVDQHVAHERVLFERLFRQRHVPAAQPLLPPRMVNIGRSAMARLEPFIEELCGVGLEVEPFGESSVTVRTLPDFLTDRDPEQLLEDLLARMESGGKPDMDHFRADLNAELACRSAIKKNHALEPLQAQALLELLIGCDTPLTCPHGRPVMKKIALAELERGFGRR
jgi:DNA mismatch repair protein MutL